MVFLIADKEKQCVTLVVKAKNEVEFQDRITLKNRERICGRLSDVDLHYLDINPFTVISI